MIESHDEGSAGDKARLLDQGERGRRARGAVQRVWASLEYVDTKPKAAGQGPSKRGYRPQARASPVDIFGKMNCRLLDCLKWQLNIKWDEAVNDQEESSDQ